jgi:hypothetical protein
MAALGKQLVLKGPILHHTSMQVGLVSCCLVTSKPALNPINPQPAWAALNFTPPCRDGPGCYFLGPLGLVAVC